MISLMEELHNAGFKLNDSIPMVHCKAFEDNSGALEMARVHKLRLQTKHINIKYHHFREAVREGQISIHKIDTTQQEADIFTKPFGRIHIPTYPKIINGLVDRIKLHSQF